MATTTTSVRRPHTQIIRLLSIASYNHQAVGYINTVRRLEDWHDGFKLCYCHRSVAKLVAALQLPSHTDKFISEIAPSMH